jgi:muramoyltetrapeptide carboxypeptidase
LNAARRGAAIGFTAPSGFLVEPAQIERAAAWFGTRGWRVLVGDTCTARDQRFAGPDAQRAEELNRFCTDRSLDVVMAARGGYGLTRILERIDFPAIARAGRTVVGYSDFTAFNLALLATTGAVSYQGPCATDFAADPPDAFLTEHFLAAIHEPRIEVRFDADGPGCDVSGTLWGGNLALLCALVGTPWWPQVDGGILFVEDVNETAYRVERMLLQLAQCGALNRQKALILGSFEPMPILPNDNGYDRAAVVATLRQRITIPVVDGLPFGHGPRRLTLPVGAMARLRLAGGRAALNWDRAAAAG